MSLDKALVEGAEGMEEDEELQKVRAASPAGQGALPAL